VGASPQPIFETTAPTNAPLIKQGYLLAFAVVTSLFFMWAIANNLNDILIKQFQKALDLSRLESSLLQTIFYLGYFCFALPAGWAMTRVGYKNGLLIGLALYATGAFLFYPAAEARVFANFLVALFLMAGGLAFLEVGAGPSIMAMGPRESAAQRLNLAQSFNGLGGFLAPFLGGALIFSGVEHSEADLAAMSPTALDAYRQSEALAVQTPYVTLGGVVLLVALAIFLLRFPHVDEDPTRSPDAYAGRPLWTVPPLRWGFVALFFYVGAQVATWSYFINFVQDSTGAPEKSAAYYLGISLMGFMVGRFTGTALMRFIAPERLLALYGLIAAGLCLVAMVTTGWIAVIALGLTSFFMSIMYPTIYVFGVRDLGPRTKFGASCMVLAILGAALFPPLMGWVAQITASLHIAIIVPLVSHLVVAMFGLWVARTARIRTAS
jgi:FHS family L-fucose permease-like MFS transporter